MRIGTLYQFAHHRVFDGERHLIWGNGIGEVLVPVNSPEYREALLDRNWIHNALVDEGETDILNVYFRNANSPPATFYGRLYTAAPSESSTLSSINSTECASGNGYPGSTVQWTRGTSHFTAPSDVSGSMTTTAGSRTWSATGTWTASLTHFVLSDAASGTSGKLIAWSALTTARSLVNLDTLDVSVNIGLT